MKCVTSHCEDLDFYSKKEGEALEDIQQRNDMILGFKKDLSGYRDENRLKETRWEREADRETT